MAIDKETEVESEFAKTFIMTCEDIDEDYRKTLVNLIDTSKMATNGISTEEKIQRITELIQKLTVSQVGLIKSIKNTIVSAIKEQYADIDSRIVNKITEANLKQCANCKAMKHADDIEKEKQRKEIIDDFMRTSGMTLVKKDNDKTQTNESENYEFSKKNLFETAREILLKPYIWIFGSILVFSPYGFNIIKLLIDTFANKGV